MIELMNQSNPVVKPRSIREIEKSLDTPTEMFGTAPLAVITCHFNWGGHARPAQNLLRFVRDMELGNGLPVFGIELVMEGEEAIMADCERWKSFTVSEKARLWQKEALLNEASKLVPFEFEFVAALDADVWFSNKTWAQRSAHLLEYGARVVQPFSDAVWTNEQGGADLIRPSSAKTGLDQSWHGHPGFAWAFHRDFFRDVGFYEFSALGTGDIVTAAGLLDETLPSTCKTAVGEKNFESGVFYEWRDRAFEYMNGEKPGYVEGSVWHEWHGSRKNRNYADRSKIMQQCDVIKDIRKTNGGWLEWSDDADDEMISAVSKHFSNRKEDGE